MAAPIKLDVKAPADAKAGGRKEGDRYVRLAGSGRAEYEPLVTFCNNFVITSQYTWYTFLPVNLFQQFLNLANVYFLIIGALQIIPQISTTNGNPTMYQPLAFIIAVSALRAAKEDYDKHRADAARNGYRYNVLRGTAWDKVQSGDLAVGDVVKVMQNEMIPADMVIIGSALAQGDCFIDKANLNGETRLEVVSSLIPTRDWCVDETDYYLEVAKKRKADALDPANAKPDPPLPPLNKLSTLKADITYEPPNKNFDTFRGVMTVDGLQAPIPLDGKCLLMRETNLRNCPYVYGVVMYTGNDTKIQMSNSQGEKAKVKKSNIMRLVDRFLVGCLLFQVALCFIAAIIAGVWHGSYADDMWFLGYSGSDDTGAPLIGFAAFWTWFIILCQMVPISLIVSAEMVKFIQSLFISMDATLYFGQINKPTKCNSSTIHEDLGLVDYVFSDKTGTLTQNKMTFRYALLTFGTFGSAETEISKAVKLRQHELQQRKEKGSAYVPAPATPWTQLVAPLHAAPNPRELDCCEVNCPAFQDNCWREPPATQDDDGKGIAAATTFSDAERKALLDGLWRVDANGDSQAAKERRQMLKTYMIHMALSNTVKPYTKEGKICFQAESAEEAAMVQFAREMGFFKKKTSPTVIEITEYDGNVQNPKKVLEEYDHVATLGFTSERARVAVVYVRTDNPRCPAHADPGCEQCAKCPLHGNNKCQESTCVNKDGGRVGDWRQGWTPVHNDEPPVHVMVKGQDAKVLPLLKAKPDEVKLMTALTGMCNNGLRTLVCGYSLLPHAWWLKYADEYEHVSQMGPSKSSEGHGENPRKCKRDECEKCLQHALYQKIEMDAGLAYLGCTGLEDQLQQLVPECIQDCLRAGIKVWMITGDKLETARNIGMACNLIDSDMAPQIEEGDDVKKCLEAFNNARLLEITGQWASLVNNRDELTKLFNSFDDDSNGRLSRAELQTFLGALKFSVSEDKMKSLLDEVDRSGQGVDCENFIRLMQSCKLSMFDAVSSDINEAITRVAQLAANNELESYPVSILVNRDAFTVMYDGKTEKEHFAADHVMPTKAELDDLKDKFFKLASVSKSLVFAQALPTMKKRMVTEIQARVPGVITLAIGDGANDVDMIMAAHVGVGIAGIEGTAATNSADYAIGTFRMLHTLLFVHGFWSYQRMASLVTFIFYKASLVAITMYFFGFYSGFSGTQFFNDAPYQLYNVMYTALPVIATAVLDRALPARTLENTPEVYAQAKGRAFTAAIFFRWIFRACLHGLCIFFVPVLALDDGSPVVFKDGTTHDLWFTSTVVYYAAVLLPTFMILFEMYSWTFLHMMALLSSLFSLYIVTLIINVLQSLDPDLYYVVYRIYACANAWLTLILALAIPLIVELVFRYSARHLSPSYTDVIQEHDFLLKQTAYQRMGSGLDASAAAATNGSAPPAPKPGSPKSPLRHDANKASALEHLKTMDQKSKEVQAGVSSDKLQAAVIKSMLRFRNLTGSQYDSAAQARLQTHDKFVRAPRASDATRPAGASMSLALSTGMTVSFHNRSSSAMSAVDSKDHKDGKL